MKNFDQWLKKQSKNKNEYSIVLQEYHLACKHIMYEFCVKYFGEDHLDSMYITDPDYIDEICIDAHYIDWKDVTLSLKFNATKDQFFGYRVYWHDVDKPCMNYESFLKLKLTIAELEEYEQVSSA